MKKLFAIVLVCAMLAGQIVSAKTDTAAMEAALLTVKTRVEIPAELTEFESRTFARENGSTYSFQWRSADGEKNMTVTADEAGNISDVSVYDAAWYEKQEEVPHLYNFRETDAKNTAQAYLEKLVPAAFADSNDCLVYDSAQSRGNVNSSVYTTNFVRRKNGILVPSCGAHVQLRILPEGGVVSNCSVTWDYDAEFASAESLLENASAAFAEKFPLELAYRKLYQKDDQTDILLEYTLPRAQDAFLDAKTGEIVIEDPYDVIFGVSGGGSNAKESAAMDMAAQETALSPAERQELENVAGLLSAQELADKLKEMPELKLSADMETLEYGLSKQQETYICSLSLDNTQNQEKNALYRHLSAQFDAKTGEIYSIYNNDSEIMPIARDENGELIQLTADEVAQYRKKADDFLEKYFPERLAQVDKTASEPVGVYTRESRIGVTYPRLIQGIPYPDNYITASWSVPADRLNRFNSEWDQDISKAPDAKQAITQVAAYDAIFVQNPLELRYICAGGIYQVVWALSGWDTTVNAISGMLIDYSGEVLGPKAAKTYSDLETHWAGDMIRTLSEYGIRLLGEEFLPDQQILQQDYLMLLADVFGVYWKDTESLYERLITRGILSKEEKAPEATVKKEDALKYLIRMMGVGSIAELDGIYICDFPDAEEISKGKVGYCAIAKGFGIVSGAGGRLEPQKQLTRAEAVTLMYQFLTK